MSRADGMRDACASAVPAQGPGEARRTQMESWGGCSVGTSNTNWGGTSGTHAKCDEGNTITVPRKLIIAHLLGPSANRFILCFLVVL